MKWKRKKGFFIALSVVLTFIFSCIVMSLYDAGQAASPAVGLDKHEKAGLTCQSCHKELTPPAIVPGAQCMTCHGDLKKLISKSSKAIPNPHASPHITPGEQPKCEECHHIHKPSEVSCYSCHQDFKYKMP
jgi:hypothetical protein